MGLNRAIKGVAIRTVVVLEVLAVGGCGLATTSGRGAREVHLTSRAGATRGKVSQAELQEELQRFTGSFVDRVAQAMYEAIGETPADATSNEVMRMALVYSSSAFDIATEPLPEIGVLDMVVFLRLSREVTANYWVPRVLGERGQPLLRALEESERTFWPIADRILKPDQKANLMAAIDAWRQEHPDQVRVEAVRFIDFAAQAGAVAAARAEEARGLLASVKAITAETDQAVLLGERGLFLMNRMPFLLRVQGRLGAREVLGDTARTVGEFDTLAKSLQGLGPALRELPRLVAATTEAVRESRQLVKETQPLVPSAEDMARLQRAIDTSNKLVADSSTLVAEVNASMARGSEGPVERVSRRVDSVLTRVLWYVIGLGAAWSALWWGGYVLAKRAVGQRPPRPPPTSQPGHDLQGRVARGAT